MSYGFWPWERNREKTCAVRPRIGRLEEVTGRRGWNPRQRLVVYLFFRVNGVGPQANSFTEENQVARKPRKSSTCPKPACQPLYRGSTTDQESANRPFQ